MTMIWNRRRPSLLKRILGSLLLTTAAVGVSIGAELLRRKLRIGTGTVEVARNGRRARVRITVRKSSPRRRSRSVSVTRS